MPLDPQTPGSQTRQIILDTSHQLFLANGYHGTSMRLVAQKAGIALSSIYNHFRSKEEIFLAVILTHHPVIRSLPALVKVQGETVEEFVHNSVQSMVDALGIDLDFINLMFIEFVEFDGCHLPELFQEAFPQVMEFTDHFTKGRENLRPIPPAILVRVFLGLFLSYALTEKMVSWQLPEELQVNALPYFTDIYLHGILRN